MHFDVYLKSRSDGVMVIYTMDDDADGILINVFVKKFVKLKFLLFYCY